MPTHEQQIADRLLREHWAKLYEDDNYLAAGDVPTCEEMREALLTYADWLRQRAECLRSPISRVGTLAREAPDIHPSFGGDLDCVLEDVSDVTAAVREWVERGGAV